MTPEQLKKLADDVATMKQTLDALQSASKIPNNIEGAFRDRLFELSPLDKDTFVTTLTSTPGGVKVPSEPVGYIELSDDYYTLVYKKT